MSQHGGEVDLIAMYDENDMEGAYLKAALGRLMVTCDFKDIATYESSVRRMEASHGRVNPELSPLILNQDFLELIKLDSKEANERIGKKGFFRWQEENRKPGDILMEGSNNLAYGLMMYHSAMVQMDALSKQQRDVRVPKKAEQQGKSNQQGEAKQQGDIKQQSGVAQNGGQEGKGVEGGSGANPSDTYAYQKYKQSLVKGDVLENSNEIISGDKFGDKNLINELTKDGSSISDWSKMESQYSYTNEYGTGKIHYYKNMKTGEVSYYDAKMKISAPKDLRGNLTNTVTDKDGFWILDLDENLLPKGVRP